MGKVSETKKGMVTLGVLLLASALLFLVVSISLYSNSLKSTNIQLANLERVNAQSDAPAFGAKNILLIEAVNVKSGAQGNNITFEENLTIPAGYATDLSAFKQFIENYSEINTSLNITGAQRPTMYILPQEITVDHPTSPNQVTFTPLNSGASAGNVSGYSILIKTNEDNPKLKWEVLTTLPASDPNALFFYIEVQGTSSTETDTQYLNKYATSSLNIKKGGTLIADVDINSPAALSVNYSSMYYLNTTIQLNSTASVELGRNIINVTQTREIEKIGQVIIVEG